MARSPDITKIGIVFALWDEARGLKRALAETQSPPHLRGDVLHWWIGKIELMAAVSGIGRKHCEATTQRLIHEGAGAIICAGLAAALDPMARAGDVFVAGRVILDNNGNAAPIPCTPSIVGTVPPGGSAKFTIRHSDIATTDSIVCGASDKSRIFRSTGAAALDMESYATAEVCTRMNVPFVAIRSISDTADQDLPKQIRDLSRIMSLPGRIALVLSHPHIWPQLARLRAQSRIASDNLGDVLGLMILRMA